MFTDQFVIEEGAGWLLGDEWLPRRLVNFHDMGTLSFLASFKFSPGSWGTMTIQLDSIPGLALCLLYLPVWCLWRPEAGVLCVLDSTRSQCGLWFDDSHSLMSGGYCMSSEFLGMRLGSHVCNWFGTRFQIFWSSAMRFSSQHSRDCSPRPFLAVHWWSATFHSCSPYSLDAFVIPH